VLTCIPLTTMGFMAGPALVSMLSVSVQSDMQGTLQGLISSINGVAAVLTPIAMPWIFGAFSTGRFGWVFPGAPYLLSAVLAVVGVAFIRLDARQGVRAVSRQEAIE